MGQRLPGSYHDQRPAGSSGGLLRGCTLTAAAVGRETAARISHHANTPEAKFQVAGESLALDSTPSGRPRLGNGFVRPSPLAPHDRSSARSDIGRSIRHCCHKLSCPVAPCAPCDRHRSAGRAPFDLACRKIKILTGVKPACKVRPFPKAVFLSILRMGGA